MKFDRPPRRAYVFGHEEVDGEHIVEERRVSVQLADGAPFDLRSLAGDEFAVVVQVEPPTINWATRTVLIKTRSEVVWPPSGDCDQDCLDGKRACDDRDCKRPRQVPA